MNKLLVTITLDYNEVMMLQEYREQLDKNLRFGQTVQYQLIRKIGKALDDMQRLQAERRNATK